MKDKLTKKETEIMETVRDEWLGRFNRLEFNEQKAKELVNFIYSISNIAKPKTIILDSPLACQIAANMVDSKVCSKVDSEVDSDVSSKVYSKVASKVRSKVDSKVCSKVGSKVGSEVRSEVYTKVRSEVRSKVYSKVGSEVRSEVRSKVYSKVGSEVDPEVHSKVRSKVGSEVRSEVRSKVYSKVGSEVSSDVHSKVCSKVGSEVGSEVRSKVDSEVYSKVASKVRSKVCSYYYPFYYGDVSDYGWTSFYDYFTRIGIINNKDFNRYCELIKAGAFYTTGTDNGYCFISRPPTILKRNHKGDMDCKDGYAIEFADGYGQYYVNGVSFDEELFNKAFIRKGMSGRDILTVGNAEQKAILIQEYGYDKIISDTKAILIDRLTQKSRVNGKDCICEVLDIELDNRLKARVLRLDDHSQDKTYFIGVPRTDETNTVLKALAWKFPVEGKSYAPVMES